MKTDIKSYTLDELKCEMEKLGEKAFKAKQIYSWLHKRGAESFDEMTDISKNLRENLKNSYVIHNCSIEKKLYFMKLSVWIWFYALFL